MTELEHNQVIRVRGLERENRNFMVRTPRGVNESAKYGKLLREDEVPWVIRETQAAEPSLVGGPQLADERNTKFLEAVEIRHGQNVRIEGQNYKVFVNLIPGYAYVEFQRVAVKALAPDKSLA